MPKTRTRPYSPSSSRQSGRLTPLAPAGRNPGALNGHVHVPATRVAKPPLVVVLHGCTQTAGGYDRGSGWSTLADRHGFVLLFPEQTRANNGNLCFNWFEPGDIARGGGEVESIREMIEQVAAEQDVDRSRIFVTGLSAGGAMAAVMLAAHPELFAAGAIIAGLPYGFAASVPEALERMRTGPRATDAMLAARVRDASGHRGAWPRLSVWHGDADRTVSPINADAIVRQWTALHGLPPVPTHREALPDQTRRVWLAADGTEQIEDRLIAGMGHGTPLAAGEGDDRCGTAGAYMLDVGISSSHAIARFWGILDAAPGVETGATAAAPAATATPDRLPARSPAADPPPRRLEVIGRSHPAAAGVRNVIEDALRSAGLMK